MRIRGDQGDDVQGRGDRPVEGDQGQGDIGAHLLAGMFSRGKDGIVAGDLLPFQDPVPFLRGAAGYPSAVIDSWVGQLGGTAQHVVGFGQGDRVQGMAEITMYVPAQDVVHPAERQAGFPRGVGGHVLPQAAEPAAVVEDAKPDARRGHRILH
ncbi:hypothetical protein ACFQYP_50425 [Nonomuraea antimicrobica]